VITVLKMFASSSVFLKISEQTCFPPIFDLHSDSLGACSYTPFFFHVEICYENLCHCLFGHVLLFCSHSDA